MLRSRACLLLAIVFSLNLAFTNCVRADAPVVSAAIRQAMQDRDYAAAEKAIDAEIAKKDAPVDYLLYLKSRAAHEAGQYDRGVAICDDALKQLPESPWARRIRFAKGAALARKGDYRAAQAIYEAEAQFLLSDARKAELADVFLEFAAGYFKPQRDDQQPDYEKALRFYEQALVVGTTPEKELEVKVRIAECFQRQGSFSEAINRYTRFLAEHADTPHDVEVRFQLGQSHLDLGQPAEARRVWEDLLDKHADDPSPRIAEATFLLAHTHGAPNEADAHAINLAVAALDRFLKDYPDHDLAPRAHLEAAQRYLHAKQFEKGAARLRAFLADPRYGEKDEIPTARYLLGRALQMQRKFDDAVSVWREFLAAHPTDRNWSAAQAEIVRTEFLIADQQRIDKNFAEARKLYGEFLTRYPLDERAPQILFTLGQMQYDEEKWDEAIAEWRRLASKYPSSGEARNARYRIGLTLEEKQGQYAEAIDVFRKMVEELGDGRAAARLEQLTAEAFQIATRKTYRTNQTPQVELTSRNLEKLTVRVYAVDLQTYFRKMHLAKGIESLDIRLIDPDKTFEFEVPEFEKFKQSICSIPLPMLADKGEAGVLAVTVSSKTHEATTMVVRSDLDILVKSSRDELFVFAENMRTGKAWPGAALLVSDGQKVFAEAVTGDDGVFKKSFEELKASGDVRVFAVAEGNCASNAVGLAGLEVARGLSDKGYLFTDRPAYRAGQLVHARGIIRQVDGDTYRVETDAEYQLSVIDPRNRTIWEELIKLNQFGAFHARFALPPGTPQGDYRVVVNNPATKKQYQGTFLVHEYNLPNVFLEIETPKQVYYRGEEIVGKIKARYYHGAPVAKRKVEYQLGNDRVFYAETDDEGQIEFKFPTRELREEQSLQVIARMPEFNLATAAPLRLATRGFSIALATVRPVYLSGESFEVTLTTSDAEGKPAGRKLALHVVEQIVVAGKAGERLVETVEVVTDEKSGAGRATLEIPQGGAYLLRAEGVDRFGTTITGTHNVQISGEEDKIRLRILAERHTFRAGDVAEVNVHWREAPALALITHQGARVLDYQIVTLETGDNPLQIAMTPQLAPNFELEIAVLTDQPKLDDLGREQAGQLHLANSPFTVEQDLRVQLSVRRANDQAGEPLPGEAVEVDITAADPQGNPVEAELSLAMVERALLDRFGERVAPIDQFFRGAMRKMAVRAGSSIGFGYQPATQPINARLLSEVERREVAESEERRLSELPARSNAPAPTSQPAFGPPGSIALGALADDAMPQEEAELDEVMVFDALVADEDVNGDPFGGEGQGGGAGGFAGRGMQQRESLRRYGGRAASGKDAAKKLEQGVQVDGWAQFGEVADFDSRQAQMAGTALARVDVKFNADATASFQRQWLSSSVATAGKDGEFRWENFSNLDAKEARKAIDRLTRRGDVLLPGLAWQETGYWNPAIVTDKQGKATVQVTLPSRSTAWKLMAKGITTDSLAGQAEAELAASKPLFAEIALPQAFTDGDTANLLATVHHPQVKAGKIRVKLTTTIGSRSFDETKEIDAAAGGIARVPFRVKLDRANSAQAGGEPASSNPRVMATFELLVEAGNLSDTFRRSAAILPYGEPVFAARSGSAQGDTTTWIELPAEMPVSDPRLEIEIGPSVERSLLDVVFGQPHWCQLAVSRYASTMEMTTSDLLASVALQQLLGATRDAANPHADALDRRIRSSIGAIVSAQQDDGGFTWTGLAGASNHYVTARVVWSLSAARRAGYVVPDTTLVKAAALLQTRVAETANEDFETKAVLFHALAAAGRGDFALANRIHRSRASLSSAGLVYLALGFAEMDRKELAAETLATLADRDLDASAGQFGGQGSLPANHAGAELRALYAYALQRTTPGSAKLTELIDWLLANRVGNRWSPDKATGPAMLALCGHYQAAPFEADKYELTVFVNGNQVEKVAVDAASPTHAIRVPKNFLVEGKQRVQFTLNGRGRYAYSCTLGGFVPADQLKNANATWHVTRYYEPGPIEDEGVTIPRGFGILSGSYSHFRNPLTQLPIAKKGIVELRIHRDHVNSQTREEQVEYLVVTEPIPAGAAVIESSISGGFERYELSPGAITFFVGSRPYVGNIRYELRGQLAGEYRAGPTIVRDAYRPDRLAVADAKSLSVLPMGVESDDKYRLTPEELFALGRRRFEAKKYDEAAVHLKQLLADWNLNAETYRQATLWMLDVSLAGGPPAEIVRYFEIVKEKWPDVEISFDKILKIGHAYHEIGEYERSYLVFRATVESRFLRESRVAGFLREQGEFLRSVDVMSRVMRQYPPEPYLAAATYALAQQVFAKAPEAAGDESLRAAKLTRVDLVDQALRMLDSFLTQWPADPAADQASFSLAGGLLELKQFDKAIAACNRYAERYPKSQYLDSYWYTIGYCHFARGEHKAALDMCRKVAETKLPDPRTGRPTESRNRWRAVYILGQIYHSLGQAAEAIAEYQ
ncbi:MAG: tetratricopeptide repeat protein, partial [Planctomycetales bacterium]|nr:tetratricopeptide repeat protein [Planctomycetales bacterium]